MMHVGIFAKTFARPTLEETLDAVVDHGLWHVQFNMSSVGLPTLPERIDEDLSRWIAQSLRERGMTMVAISGTFNLCDPDLSRLEDNLQRLDVLAAACRWLDTRIITLCTGTRDPEEMWKWHPENVRRSTWETLVKSIKQAAKIADHHEVTLAFEPEMHNVVNTVSKARRLLDEIDSPWLKVVIDPANLIPSGDMSRVNEIFSEAFDWLCPDVVLAHAKSPRNDVDAGALLALEHHVQGSFGTIADIEWFRADRLQAVLSEPVQETVAEVYLFYRVYFTWLKKSGFAGPVIIHGLDESQVREMKDFLTRQLLRRDPY
jgi:sugar phosphate isomerase/epimerase